MLNRPLSLLAQWCDGTRIGRDVTVSQLHHDSRTLSPGDCFLAIRGTQFDGHDFLAEAQASGACAAIVSRQQPIDIPQILVKDTIIAFGQIANNYRRSFAIPIIALTGSCGKTTTKGMIAQILAQHHRVHATKGTYNNEIGLPITLLHLSPEHQISVLELGANHCGEIDRLTRMALPDIAMILNIHAVHIDGFGSIEGVARGKGEIFHGLKPGSIAIIPAQSPYRHYWDDALREHHVWTFGAKAIADVGYDRVRVAAGKTCFDLHFRGETVPITLNLLGEHNVPNAVAASAAALAQGMSLAACQRGLNQFQPVTGRLNMYQASGGATLIDDTYNANPTGTRAAIDVLCAQPETQKYLVLGHMAELGPQSEAFHAEIGHYAREQGVNALLSYTGHAAAASHAFGRHAKHYDCPRKLHHAVAALDHADSVILVKGSRMNRLENLIKQLRTTYSEHDPC